MSDSLLVSSSLVIQNEIETKVDVQASNYGTPSLTNNPGIYISHFRPYNCGRSYFSRQMRGRLKLKRCRCAIAYSL
jgi:hypothetical protein